MIDKIDVRTLIDNYDAACADAIGDRDRDAARATLLTALAVEVAMSPAPVAPPRTFSQTMKILLCLGRLAQVWAREADKQTGHQAAGCAGASMAYREAFYQVAWTMYGRYPYFIRSLGFGIGYWPARSTHGLGSVAGETGLCTACLPEPEPLPIAPWPTPAATSGATEEH